MKTVSAVMSPVNTHLSPDDTVSSAIELMQRDRLSCVLVCENKYVTGIVTERDILKIFAAQFEANKLSDLPLRQAMTFDPITVHRDTLIRDALILARSRRIRHMPVVDDADKVCGLITQNDTIDEYLLSLEANMRLREDFEQIRVLALEDPLLGIGNRRALDVDLRHTEASARRSGKKYSVTMMDVDFFKRFNDLYGHQEGDKALKKVTQVIRDNMRDSDRLYRYGGEEFLLLMSNTDINAAQDVAQRILEKIKQRSIKHEDSQVGVLTLSAGVAEAASGGKTAIKHADAALYDAKQNGRNQVVRYTS